MEEVSKSLIHHNIIEENNIMKIYHFFLILYVFVILGCSKDGEIVTEKKDEKVHASYCLVYVFNPNLVGSHQTEIRNLREGGLYNEV